MGNNTPIPPKHKFTTCTCANPRCSHPINSISRNECKSCGSATILDGRYRMLKTLGRGGFGHTYLAIDEHLPFHPFCVVKILHNSQGTMHFEREALGIFF